jgi:hypothetical protein
MVVEKFSITFRAARTGRCRRCSQDVQFSVGFLVSAKAGDVSGPEHQAAAAALPPLAMISLPHGRRFLLVA